MSRGNMGILLKDINGNVTRFSSNLMDCKLLRKCRKEEAPTRVIVVVVMFSWASYLLNQFFIDCRDAQDNGTDFHYSWLIILIYLEGWMEPKFSSFLDRKGKCYAVRYDSLWQAKDNKNQQENNTVFVMLLEEIQRRTADSWHIHVEVVQEIEGIASFRASRNHMWIQAVRDPNKAWLEMQYCVTREEIDWIIKD
jgi:hypothetical protein